MIKLTVRPTEGPEQVFTVQKQSATVGRGSNCDIVIVAEGVSRQHMKIDASRTGVCYITDLGSTNGVMVDNKRIKPNVPTPYAPFHSLSIGSIPALMIETGVPAEKTLAAYRNVLRTGDKTGEIQLEVPAEKTTSRPRPPKLSSTQIDTSAEKKPVVAILVGVILIAALTYYFFLH